MPDHDAGCFQCSAAISEDDLVGGWVLHDALVAAYRSPNLKDVPGWYQVQINRHAPTLADLSDEEARAIGFANRQLAHALSEVSGHPKIYSYSMAENSPHYHLVLGPAPEVAPGEQRAGALLTRLLARDPALFDADRATMVAHAVRDLLRET